MSIVAEVYLQVNNKAQKLVRCEFEVAPEAGDELLLPGDKRVKVVRAHHVAAPTPPGQPLRMQYELLVK